MATALKHKQRSHRSYQKNRSVMGSVAVASSRMATSHYYRKAAGNSSSIISMVKQMFGMKKGDR